MSSRYNYESSCSEGLLGDDVVELLLRYKAVVVGVGSLHHFLQLALVDGLAQLLGYSAEVLDRNEAGLFVVKQVEYFSNVFSGVLVGDTGGHQFQKLLEIDLTGTVSIEVGNHLVDGLVFRFKAE